VNSYLNGLPGDFLEADVSRLQNVVKYQADKCGERHATCKMDPQCWPTQSKAKISSSENNELCALFVPPAGILTFFSARKTATTAPPAPITGINMH
jgi:hypothetical protein